jgi:hypothetical protein
MIIKVSPIMVCGRVLYQPENKTAELLLKVVKHKHFTKPQIAIFKEIGFEVEIIKPDVKQEYRV